MLPTRLNCCIRLVHHILFCILKLTDIRVLVMKSAVRGCRIQKWSASLVTLYIWFSLDFLHSFPFFATLDCCVRAHIRPSESWSTFSSLSLLTPRFVQKRKKNDWATQCAEHMLPLNWLDYRSILSAHKWTWGEQSVGRPWSSTSICCCDRKYIHIFV